MRLRRRQTRVDWTGWQPSDPVVFDLRRYMRRHRRANVGAYLLVVIVAAAGAYTAAQDRARNCRAINDTRRELRVLIRQSEAATVLYEQEGTISLAQLRRAIKQARSAQRRLRPIDCKSS